VQVTSALKTTVMSLQGQIKWGLEFFPSDDSCGVGATVDVAVASMNATQITNAINGKSPGGSTPTRTGIDNGVKYLSALTDPNPKYILLATDGEPNCSAGGGACSCPAPLVQMGNQCCLGPLCTPCPGSVPGGPDGPGAIDAVDKAAKAGIGTFVIGIATDSSAEGVLNDMATKGLHPRPGAQKYYPVANQNDLVTAINTIAGQIISCNFPLAMPPSAPDLVDIFVNGMKVTRDPNHQNGWDFGPGNSSIQFYGAACTSLQSGSAQQVQAIYNCPPIS
jgi:hypothetical protein